MSEIKPLEGNVIVKMRLHNDKERNWEIGERIGLTDKVISETFGYALYEVEFDVEVNVDNGQHRIVAVDGLPHDGKWNG